MFYRNNEAKICGNLRIFLGYLKDSNAAAHSVNSDIFYAVIH